MPLKVQQQISLVVSASTDTQLVTVPGELTGILILSDADTTNNPTVRLYDGTGTGGTRMFDYTLDIDVEGIDKYIPLPNIRFATGLYLDIAGANADCIAFYRK